MGMSASQARLISLEARMNDIEYQGQQINQQRTTLSNQVNTLYNQLIEQEVPTPPSTSDYTKVQYSGMMDASSFTMGSVIPTGNNSAGKSTYSIDFQYQRSGHSVQKNKNSAIITNTSQYLTYSNAASTIDSCGWIVESTKGTLGDQLTELPTTKDEDGKDVVDNDKDVYLAVDVSEYNSWKNKSSALGVYDQNGNSLEGNLPSTGTVYVKCNVADLNTEEFKSLLDNPIYDEEKDENDNVISSTFTSCDNLYDINPVTTKNIAGWLTDDTVASMNLYYVSGTSEDSVPQLIETVDQLKSILGDNLSDTSKIYKRDDNSETKFTNPNYDPANASGTGLSVGDMPVYEMDSAKAIELMGESYKDYVTALVNAFRNEYGNQGEYANIEEAVKDAFYVYFSKTEAGEIIPHFVKKNEISQIGDNHTVRTYEYDADGTYTQVDNKDNCQLEFDPNTGRITRVGIPDNNGQISWVDVKSETVTDQEAYNEAFNDYEYDKALYDKRQQEINAKTKIVQQQDKNLELKLTRLDNERNALKTEIDAVKKVIQENIESSYKTFSG